MICHRRNRVGVNAAKFWGDELPKFNTPKRKVELSQFADSILEKCAMPEIGFDKEAIMKHTKDFFNEQRRYSKRKCHTAVAIEVSVLNS